MDVTSFQGYGARLLSINNQTENNVVINWLQNEADKLWVLSLRGKLQEIIEMSVQVLEMSPNT